MAVESWVGIGITIGGIVLNAGVIYGISKNSMMNVVKSVSKIETTLEKFGSRIGKTEADIQSIEAVCEERHR